VARKKLLLRMTDEDQVKIDMIAESIGGVSRTAAVRFIIRQWFTKKDQFDINVVKPSSPP
jgi:hypothetical protein